MKDVIETTVTFSLDGADVTVPEGTTIWEAAHGRGLTIPHLCHKPAPGYRPDGNCRACMVEVEGERTLVASCIRPVAEGMVAILEPFIDTLIICTLTGLVILSSGVWTEKFENTFTDTDTEIVTGVYADDNPEHVQQLFRHLSFSLAGDDPVQPYSGTLQVRDGAIEPGVVTVLHNRSVAENVRVFVGADAYVGPLTVIDGAIDNDGVTLVGRSLLHSVPLTAEAFKRSFLGEFGQYAVTIGLVLFAFSTALAWSYYGDRAMTYLFGVSSVMPYRVVYVLGFFVATIADTTLIWVISGVTLALMTLPNLFGLLMSAREIKSLTVSYWRQVKSQDSQSA